MALNEILGPTDEGGLCEGGSSIDCGFQKMKTKKDMSKEYNGTKELHFRSIGERKKNFLNSYSKKEMGRTVQRQRRCEFARTEGGGKGTNREQNCAFESESE